MKDRSFFKRYYQGSRDDLLKLIPKQARRVLDIGCGTGELGRSLKKRGCYVIGIELNSKIVSLARANLDQVIEGDIEKIELPFEKGAFDCIILADILEHLIDPWHLLLKLRYYLSENGFLICSIPNVRHYSVIKDLILGKWEYEEEGLLDKTHLRFFTLSSIKKMIEDSGYKILYYQRQIKEGWKLRFLNLLFLNILKEFITFHYLIVAQRQRRIGGR